MTECTLSYPSEDVGYGVSVTAGIVALDTEGLPGFLDEVARTGGCGHADHVASETFEVESRSAARLSSIPLAVTLTECQRGVHGGRSSGPDGSRGASRSSASFRREREPWTRSCIRSHECIRPRARPIATRVTARADVLVEFHQHLRRTGVGLDPASIRRRSARPPKPQVAHSPHHAPRNARVETGSHRSANERARSRAAPAHPAAPDGP